MDSPNSDYLSPCSGDTSPELYDAAELLEDEAEAEAKAKETETESDDERLNSSPKNAISYGYTSHWSQPWSSCSTGAEFCKSPQKLQWSLPLDNEPSSGPSQKSVGVATSLSLSTWPSQNDIKRPFVGAGMENLGNTCFLNSVLQCFIHTVPLLDGIISSGHVHSNCNKEEFCLLCALGDLIVCSLTNNIVSPHNLADNLSYISSSFQRFRQEDAHEFLQCFLNRLEICHDSVSKGHMSSESDNIVQQVFGGRLVSNLRCCNCGHCSDTYEPSIDLSLEIEDADNLLTALQSFTKVERIEDPETRFTCDKCKEQVSVEKKLSYDQAPSVAVFHLKRFKNDGCFVQKIDKHVAFPLDLDLLPFAGSGKNNDEELKFVLYAVVVHIGLTSTSGHYYCFLRLSPNMWCKFDDSRVVLVDEDFVLSQEAYILFYAKERTPWFSNFVESQKEIVHSTIWNTSPKSVLMNIDLSSASPGLETEFGHNTNESSHDFGSEHGEADGNEIKHSGIMQSNIESNEFAHNLNGMSVSVAPHPSNFPDVALPTAQIVSPILLEEVNQDQEDNKLGNCQSDVPSAWRSPSPEIYREDPPGFSIPRDHVRLVDRISCKRRLEKDIDDTEVKQACSYIKKSMSSSRGAQMLAAIRGSKNEASLNTKKSRRPGLSNNDNSGSTHHESNIRRPLRPLVAGTNR